MIAKDGEEVNPRIFAQLASALQRLERPVILDLGTGSGTLIRRLLDLPGLASATFYGLDLNRDLLETARRQTAALLRAQGFAVRGGDQVVVATKGDRAVEIHLLSGDLFDEKLVATLEKLPLAGMTAHAYLDRVPLEATMEIAARLLKRGGFFYSAINYNGMTELLPLFEDRSFEERLIAAYNRALDERRYHSLPTGGSRTGGLLYEEAANHGFRVEGFGSSDWSIFPWEGSYTREAETFLNSLLLELYEEGLRHPEIDRLLLARWYAHRNQSIDERALALLVHQTDIFAVKR